MDPDLKMMDEPALRRAIAADASRLTEIAHAAKRHWKYPETWIELWRDQLTLAPAYVETHHVELAEAGGKVVGFFALRGHADIVELDHLWIDPPWIGRGFGRQLMDRALAVCRAGGAQRIEIDSDPFAEPFYRRLGARRIDSTPAPVPGEPERYLPRLALDVAPAD